MRKIPPKQISQNFRTKNGFLPGSMNLSCIQGIKLKFTDSRWGKVVSTHKANSSGIMTEQFVFQSGIFPKHKKNVDLAFLEWFIGFSEATGYFCSHIINNGTELYFEIIQPDVKLMYKIRTTLGFGKISSLMYNNKIYWKYSVKNKLNLQRIMFLFNGNLVLPKRYAEFKEWVTLGENILPKNFNLQKQQQRISLNNGWLSGFIEAQGFFYATFRANTLNCDASNFSQKLSIIQKKKVGEYPIFEEILFLFDTTYKKDLKKISIVKKTGWYVIEFDSLKSQTSLINYLTDFPLRGNKKITFRRWWRIYLVRKTSEVKPFSLKMVEKYQKLCLRINKN